MSAPPAAKAEPKVAILKLPSGQEYSLPVLTDNVGAVFLDVRKLQSDTGARLERWAVHLRVRLAVCAAERPPQRTHTPPRPRSRFSLLLTGRHMHV